MNARQSPSAGSTAHGIEALGVLRRDGFVVVESFFESLEVDRAHQEVLALRARMEARPDPQIGLAKLGASTEILTNLYGASPALDRLVEKLLSDPRSLALLHAVGGQHFKNRDYTCRLMTGQPDAYDKFNPPLEWHRDSKGEFVIGIYLTDIPAGNNSATAFLPGSQRYPYDPRWNALLGRPFYVEDVSRQRRHGALHGLDIFLGLNPFGRLLGKRKCSSPTGAFGKAGDFYVFINETWHGRLPNENGLRAAVVQLGFFPSELPFPDSPRRPTDEVLRRLPENFRAVLNPDRPHNKFGEALVYEVLASQERLQPFTLFWYARLERKIAQFLSELVVIPIFHAKRALKPALRFALGLFRGRA